MIILGLTACTSSPRSTTSTAPVDNRDPVLVDVPLQQQSRSAQEWLAVAAQASGTAQVEALLQAAATFQHDQQWQQSAAILGQVERYFPAPSLTLEQQHLLALLEARFAAQDNRWPYVQRLLEPLVTTRLTPYFPSQALELSIRAAAAQGQWEQAATYQLQWLNTDPDARTPEQVWDVLKMVRNPNNLSLPPTGLRTREVAGWAGLIQQLHRARRNPADLTQLITQWQQDFPQHPGQFVTAKLLTLTAQPRQRVLVLLPLTGQYAEQGLAVQDGLVKGLARLPHVHAQFVDTNNLDFATLPELLQQHQADVLIGPLLKPNITQIDASQLPQDLPWLTLNEPSGELQHVLPQQHFFALDTETEIRQAATFIAQQGHRHPLIFAPANNRGQQLTDVFQQAWQAQFADHAALSVGLYSTTEEMKTAVQEQLGVSDSEARIYQVKIAAGKIIVDAQPRSRADIDAVYLVGGIEQTRLLKPFIDVNIAAFMTPLPVYANSGSHTLRNNLSENDLDNVRFTDSPWLLPGHPEQRELEQVLAQRTHWDYNNARLAAFGHDALLLSQYLPLLQTMPGLAANGLTGELRVQQQQIVRQLQWVRFRGHEVVSR